MTSLFKQIVNKLTNKGIQTINDLISDKFKSYLNNHDNYLKEEEQINNIQIYLKKEDDVRKNAKDVAAILLNNQNEISKGLEDLKKQFENAKKGVKTKLRQRSIDLGRVIRRKTFQFDDDKNLMKKVYNKNKQGINNNLNDSSAKKKNINIKPVKRNTLFISDLKGFKINQGKKNSIKKGALPKFNNKTKDNKNPPEMAKPIEEIKEEDEKDKNKEKELNESHSEKSVSNKSKSSQSQNSEKSEEKKEEENNEEKNEEVVPTPQKENIEEIESSTKKKDDKVNKKDSLNKNKKVEKKPFNPMIGVKLNKVVQNSTIQKPKKPIIHNQQNDMNAINKKLENNDKKVKLNLKKEEIEREMNIMKIKTELKKSSNYKSAFELKSSTATKKTNEPKVQGFKNIKEMIESNLNKQRVMSGTKLKK
jgi:hypothetical protein